MDVHKWLQICSKIDSSKVIEMLKKYHKKCKQQGTFPRRMLLSFAPVSSQKNIEFLKWLGVEISSETEKYLNGRTGKMIDSSLDVAIEILYDTLKYIQDNKLIIPIGLNVEHIMSYNFQSSIEMLQELLNQKVWKSYIFLILNID